MKKHVLSVELAAGMGDVLATFAYWHRTRKLIGKEEEV
jgi:hypothetical protein